MKKPLIELTIRNRQSIGIKERHWSDDEHKWIDGGPNYVRLTAEDKESDREIVLKLEIPQDLAQCFTIGSSIQIVAPKASRSGEAVAA